MTKKFEQTEAFVRKGIKQEFGRGKFAKAVKVYVNRDRELTLRNIRRARSGVRGG